MDEEFNKVVEFHGHVCPGSAIGYRVANYIKGTVINRKMKDLLQSSRTSRVVSMRFNRCSVVLLERAT